ncbi:glycosyltransferase family 4 protein [Paenibacillus alkalitolerans]|uniref:glycosyltransferase family 4 protein n=1 Tax=Paenibacillus alkalitolerans TaxID=2799335 RepID=UPI0018F45C7D|nr:glycosyltransferase family 4 protein [Paenibacillus alkalitolerans]
MTKNKRTVMLIGHHTHPEIVTGAEKALLLFGSACLDLKLTVIWISPGPGLSYNRAAQMGMDAHIIPFPLLWSLIYEPNRLNEEIDLLKESAEGSLLDQAIAGYSPDLIVTNSAINGLPIFIRQIRNIPVWWYIHETIPQYQGIESLLTLIHSHADLILVPSASVARSISPVNFELAPIELLPYGVDIPAQKLVAKERKSIRINYGWSDKHIVIGWFGSIYYGKGLIELIKACSFLQAGDNPIVILAAGNAGDYRYFQMCMNEAKQLKSAEFRYLGVLSNISEVLPAVDLVAVTSLIEEALPNVALEAMAFGKCIVAYNSGGLQEIVIDRETGVLVNKEDTKSLAKMIDQLANDPVKLKNMGKKARARVVQQYRYDLFKKKIEKMINK